MGKRSRCESHTRRCASALMFQGTCSAALVLAAGHAFAAQPAQENSATVEEVLVTARSRQERLIDVPDTITAFSSSQIERAAIGELNDFVRLTPGLSLVEASQSPGIQLINIGATAHFVTTDLDEGPIIAQDARHVTHSLSPEQMVAMGQDVECQVLARAVAAHVEHRIISNGAKTVIFA